MPPSSPMRQQSIQDTVADQVEELMVDIAKIPNRGRALNITIGVLATLAKFLRINNLLGLGHLARLCDRELDNMRSEESTSDFLAQMDAREQKLRAIADQAIKKHPLL